MSSGNDTSPASPPLSSNDSPSPSDNSSPPPPSSDNSSPPPSTSDNQPPPPPSSNNSSPPPSSSDNSPSPPPPSSGSSPLPSPPSPESGRSPPPASPPPENNPPGKDGSPPSDGDDDNGKNKKKSPPSPKSGGHRPPPPSGSEGGSPEGSPPQLGDSPPKDDSSDEKALITGAAAGAGLLLLIMIVFMISCARRKKRKRQDYELQYYRDNAPPNMKSYYNNGPSWQNSKPNDLMLKMPPMAASPGISSEHGWAAPPPPPPPMMYSSEMSSAGFSGPHQAPMPPPHPAVALGFNQSSFTYEDLAAATGGFAHANLLGQGGFGYVHKGVLPNGKEIAVKSLKSNSGQGEREFQAEVDIISRVHHRHLVSLVGWCSTGSQRMLVYEFVPNKTLEYHLHDAGRPTMDWPTRLKIALGSAKGFAYLHEDCHPRIIHRDIKAANILIDLKFEAKVADFGLAKLSSDNYTHVSTRIMGTFGYLAPEYASSGKLTEKSDVYSFGIMLLELITGRRPIDIHSDDDSLVDWARPILMRVTEGGSFEELVDPRLGNNYDRQQMLHMVACAGACVKHSARGRPRMSQIVRALEGDMSLDDLNAGSRGSIVSSSDSDYDPKRFGKGGALSSQEFSGSEEGTGERRR